jgi:hypothetical protein
VILLINRYKYLALLIVFLFSDILHYVGLSLFTKALFMLAFFSMLKSSREKDFYAVIGLGIALCISFLVGFILDQQNLSYFILPMLIISGYLLAQSDFNPYDYRTFIVYFLLINLITLVAEKFNSSYLLDYGHSFYMYQGQGLFAWSKVQGEFLIAISLIFSKDRPVLLVLLLSALLSGVRASGLLIGFLFVLTYFSSYDIRYKLNYKYIVPFIFIAIYFIAPVFYQILNDYNIERFVSLLDLDSSNYSVREYVHDLHYGCIAEYSIDQLFFGKGEYCAKLFNWGAESTILHIIEYYGLILSSILFSIMLYILVKNIHWLNYQKIAVFIALIVYMMNWRFGFTYAGILIWWYIFSALNNDK